MTGPVPEVLSAVAEQDWPRLRLLLHPYLHWTEAGRTVRGRTKVLALLAERPAVGPPESVELRDGRIYRWVCGPAPVTSTGVPAAG
jgi:hypothetical protein